MAFKHLLAGVAAIALMAQPALARILHNRSLQAGQAQLAEVNMDFAKEAAQGGLIEVRYGELAQQQAKSTKVKDFGQRMVDDHGQAGDKLMQIAKEKGLELPGVLSEEGHGIYKDQQQKSGAEFDEAYMDDMVSDHEDDVSAFEELRRERQEGSRSAQLRQVNLPSP